MNNETNKISSQLIELFENIMKIEQKFIEKESKKKISMVEVHTIAAIGIDELSNMSEIAKRLQVTVGTLTAAINNLVRKNYAERYKSEKDRRFVKIGLTRQGKEIYQIHNKFHSELAASLTKGLTEEEKAGVVKAISNLQEFVERDDKKENMHKVRMEK
ncbi:MAG: MarR family transcriptional regulator [Butyribacter sp.]|nr:MarR family transcriptional regulator [bacterium]MDY3853613.1 MarR family transcriptional regulator [Butyribacter sp.]